MLKTSSRLPHLSACLAFPHLTGNMEASCASRLTRSVFVVAGRPDFLRLFSERFGDPLFSLREAANQSNGKAGRVTKTMLECELGKRVSRLAKGAQDVCWFPVFLTGFFCITCLHDFVTVVCYRCMIKAGLNMACQRFKQVDAFTLFNGGLSKRVCLLNQVLI